MKRIDSVNARDDVNGVGKKGFHDNADLQGQDATYITPNFMNAIQEEIANVIEGFNFALDPTKNNQMFEILLAITNRLKGLEDRVIEDIKVGDLFITTLEFSSSDEINIHKGYGSWEQYGDGQALVALASSANLLAPEFMKIHGAAGGEYKHQQTESEMYPHRHGEMNNSDAGINVPKVGVAIGGGVDGTRGTTDPATLNRSQVMTEEVGGGEPFNIVQSSIIVGVWLRIS